MGEPALKFKTDRPNIFGYHDYTEFLRDQVAWLQGRNPINSLRRLSEAAGLSHGYLSHVCSGRRSLKEKQVAALVSVLELNGSEAQFLKHLVVLGEAKDSKKRLKAYQQMKKFATYQNINIDELDAYQVIAHWYTPVIRELVQLSDFQLNAKWVQKNLKDTVPLSKIEKALDFLVNKNYIVQKDGKWCQSSKNLRCVSGVYQLSLEKFHREMKEQSILAFDKTDKDLREQIGYTFAISEESFDELTKILQDTKERIKQLESKSQNANVVYHVDLAAFPLSKRKGAA